VEGGGGVTPPLNANSVVVPMRQWWARWRALRWGSSPGRCAREIGGCASTRGRRPGGRPRRRVGWVGSLSSAAHRSASSSSLRSPERGVVVRAEPRRRTARGGHRSGRLGGAWPKRSHGMGWSLEQSPMEIEREREREERIRFCADQERERERGEDQSR
jgi:hypothetical protein